MFCLNKNLAQDFLTKIKSGEIDPQKLSEMSSDKRRDYFEGFLGKANAHEVNALFESKLLLKDQQKGLITWARQVGGMKPEIKRDIISRVERMTEVLNPKTEKEFLSDLASHKLGITISMEEASHISELAKRASEFKSRVPENSPYGSPERMAHGYAAVEFGKYVNELKNKANETTIVQKLKDPLAMVVETAGVSKAMNATGDNSAIFRQGWKAMMTNPIIWGKDSVESFGTIIKSFGKKEVMDNSKARIISSEYYDKAKIAKLAVATIEEDFPTSLPEKIPLFGKLYKASETAFTVFVHNLRMDLFNKEIKIAEDLGIDTNNKEWLQGTGKLINSLTGRGDLGVLEPAGSAINNILFSARGLKGHIDVLTAHLFDPKVEPYIKKRAAINLLKIIAWTATIKMVAETLQPGSTENDPRSSDSSKIKVGSTRFDVSGGMGSVVTLAARLVTGKTKTLNGKFKDVDPISAVSQFFENKLSPINTTALALKRGKDRDGHKINVTSPEGVMRTLDMLFTPMPIKNIRDSMDVPNRANLLLIAIADGLGISTNSYSKAKH